MILRGSIAGRWLRLLWKGVLIQISILFLYTKSVTPISVFTVAMLRFRKLFICGSLSITARTLILQRAYVAGVRALTRIGVAPSPKPIHLPALLLTPHQMRGQVLSLPVMNSQDPDFQVIGTFQLAPSCLDILQNINFLCFPMWIECCFFSWLIKTPRHIWINEVVL